MRPIMLDETLKTEVMQEFAKFLQNLRLSDGKISFTQSFSYPKGDKALIRFLPSAYLKMNQLIQGFESEIGWYGTVRREDDKTFVVDDVLVYPQVVTGVTVDTDQQKIDQWEIELASNEESDAYDRLRMHGHSHVRMDVTPSGRDISTRERQISQLCDDDFFIFMIWNKSMKFSAAIYDMKNNVLYENADISVTVGEGDFDLDGFVSNAHKLVQEAPVSVLKAPKSTTKNSNPGSAPGKKGASTKWFDRFEDEEDEVYSGDTVPYGKNSYYRGYYM